MASLCADIVGEIGTFLTSQQQLLRVSHTWRQGAIEQDGGRPKPAAGWDLVAVQQRQSPFLKLKGGCDADLLSLSLHLTTSWASNLVRLDISVCRKLSMYEEMMVLTGVPAKCYEVTDGGIKHLTALKALTTLNMASKSLYNIATPCHRYYVLCVACPNPSGRAHAPLCLGASRSLTVASITYRL